jgi:hypothetical protein
VAKKSYPKYLSIQLNKLFMKKISVFCFIYLLTWKASFSQESKIIELDPVEIIPTDKLLVYSNFSKKHKENNSTVRGPSGSKKIATVSGFKNPENSTIELEGLEFFFNYNWSKDSSGFYVQPVVVGEDGLPIGGGADFPEKYLVTSKLRNRIFIDLSSKGIHLAPQERVLLGIRFIENVNPETPNLFNITALSGRMEDSTYLLYWDGRVPEKILDSGKNSAGFKYSVVYKLKE